MSTSEVFEDKKQEFVVLRLVSRVLNLLSGKSKFGLGMLLGTLWFDVFRIRRKIVLENLQIAFPEVPLALRVAIGRRSLWHMGRGFIEYFEFFNLTKENIGKKVEFHGLEYLEEARMQKKGALILSLHLGNGDFAIAGLGLIGWPMVLISKTFKLKWLNNLWFGIRAQFGTQFIPPRHSSYGILKALKKNERVIFVLDQFMGPPIGCKTQFFGKETGTAMGLAVMAHRSGAPVIPIYTYRTSDDTHVVILDSPIPFQTEGFASEAEMIQFNTQVYTHRIESIVRKYPDQWMWVHRRWKIFK